MKTIDYVHINTHTEARLTLIEILDGLIGFIGVGLFAFLIICIAVMLH